MAKNLIKFWQVVDQLRMKTELSLDDLAKRINVPSATIASQRRRNVLPPVEQVVSIAFLFSVSVDKLLGVTSQDTSITIPFISQKFSCGPGEDWQDEENIEVGELEVLPTIAKGHNKSTLLAARVKGDSMIKAGLDNGDIVVFSKNLIEGDGIYAISLRSSVLVKRLQFEPYQNLVYIISDNDNYETIKVPADDDSLIILGKVTGWLHGERI